MITARRIVVLGGYGVFGALLCELLVRDGHLVWVAGRTVQKAEALAARIGADALAVDRTGDLSPIWALEPDVVVDAAGPFHAYDGDPYSLVRACLARRVHYLDLSDDAVFTAGIGALQNEALAAGRFALSGASSVPGLSSVVLRELSAGLSDLRLIQSAILPGNRAPRGLSVIASILNQMGRPMRIWRGGAWRQVPAWSGRARSHDPARCPLHHRSGSRAVSRSLQGAIGSVPRWHGAAGDECRPRSLRLAAPCRADRPD